MAGCCGQPLQSPGSIHTAIVSAEPPLDCPTCKQSRVGKYRLGINVVEYVRSICSVGKSHTVPSSTINGKSEPAVRTDSATCDFRGGGSICHALLCRPETRAYSDIFWPRIWALAGALAWHTVDTCRARIKSWREMRNVSVRTACQCGVAICCSLGASANIASPDRPTRGHAAKGVAAKVPGTLQVLFSSAHSSFPPLASEARTVTGNPNAEGNLGSMDLASERDIDLPNPTSVTELLGPLGEIFLSHWVCVGQLSQFAPSVPLQR